jgi:hypothetical protein
MSTATDQTPAAATDTSTETKVDPVTWEGPGRINRFVNEVYTNTFGWVGRQYDKVCEAIYADDLRHYEAMERAGVIKRLVTVSLD